MNRILIAITLALTLGFLPGCLDKADRMQTTAPSINHSPTLPSPTKGDLDGAKAEIVDLVSKRMDTSENAIQTNMQSLVGVSVGKVSDDLVKLQAQFHSLAEVNAKLENNIHDINTNMNASLASNNDLRVMLKNQMDFNASMVATIKLSADIEAKISVMGAAQAGINIKIDQQTQELKQSLSAGHDVNNTTTQFSQQMLDALRSANQTTSDTSKQWAWILAGVVAMVGVLGMAYMHRQKTNAEARAMTANKELSDHRVKLERALSIMTTGVPDK